jgi:microcystin-dependent protein
MSEPFIGQITMFGGNFAPRGYALCNGQLLSINQNQALFSLIGTFYGGNGVQNFALPNLQSRLSVHNGSGQGLSPYALGQSGGEPSVTLNRSQMPSHMHSLVATTGPANSGMVGSGVVPATSGGSHTPAHFYAAVPQGGQPLVPHTMNPAVCGNAGGSQPHSNLMPSLCITFVIALQGIFPSRV